MLEFIIGGAGTGKTHRIIEAIKEDIREGRPAILLVPEQETVARERAMLEVLPPSAQLSFEVLNFTRLANSVFRKYGGLTYNYVSAPVKALAMWNTMRLLTPLLKEYGKRSRDAALSSLMLSQIEEFKAYCISPVALERAAKNAPNNSRLQNKLSDLALIYSAYGASISEYGGGDASDDIGKLAKKLEEHNFFADTNVYIDSFTSFTAAEEAVISHILRQASRVSVALSMPAEDSGGVLQFESIKNTAKRLERIAEKCECDTEKTFLHENFRTRDISLCRLSRDIWRFDAKPDKEQDHYKNGSVSLIKCTNAYEEAEAVTAIVSKLVKEGMRYKDILILARKAESYEGIIDSSLDKANIPYFMSKSEDVTAMPLAKLLILALRIKNMGWRTDDVITYIKTGLTGIPEREADIFEQYIWKWSIGGKTFLGDDFTMDPYSYSGEPDEKGKEVLAVVNSVKRAIVKPLCALFEKIDKAESNRDACIAVFEYMEELSAAQSMKDFADQAAKAGNGAEAAAALKLYNSVLDILGILAEFDFGEPKLSCEDFEEALRIALSETEIGVIPTSCDEVACGSAYLFRADEPKCVILMGVNDGVFPENIDGGMMLSDEDKAFLAENGIELSADGEEKNSEELFYVYRAISAPSERLIMTYSASELQGGKELRPSLAFERTRSLLCLPVIDYSALKIEERLWNPEIAFEYAFLAEGEAGEALKRYFSENEDYRERLSALYIPIFDRECKVPKDITDMVFGNRMSFSPSALEKYVKCHFEYWCEYVLRLRSDEKNVFSFSDSGSLIHALLEKFLSLVTDENGFNAAKAEEEGEELLSELMRLYVEENFPTKDAKREQVAHVIRKLTHLSHLVAKNITHELKKSKFSPKFFELRIGENREAKPLSFTLSDGSVASMKGIVDRVDTMRDGDNIYVKVVDYKTGAKEFSLSDVERGLNMQMLLYLFSLSGVAKNKELFGCSGHGKVLPAGVVYLSSRIPGISGKSGMESEEIEKEAESKLSRSGILLSDEKVLSAISEDMDFNYILSGAKSEKKKREMLKSEEEMADLGELIARVFTEKFDLLRSGNAFIEPMECDGRLPCEYCRMKSVCRSVHIVKESEGDGENG